MRIGITIRRHALALVAAFIAGCAALQPLLSDAAPASADVTVAAPAGEWRPFREFWFHDNRAELQRLDAEQVTEIATYLGRHPGQRVAIDGSISPRHSELSNFRIATVRNALLQAGVPAHRIETGDFGNPRLRRGERVEVLLSDR